MTGSSQDDNVLVIGKLGAPHGVAGGLRLFSFTNPINSILQYDDSCLLEQKSSKKWGPVKFEKIQKHKDCFIAYISGVSDRDAAALLTHSQLGIVKTQLQSLNEEEQYWADLIDLEVYNKQGDFLGKVVSLMETGANDVLVVGTGKDERLLPYTDDCIIDVDIEANKLLVDWDVDF